MKTLKLAALSLMAGALASTSSQAAITTVVHVVGSSAFRAGACGAIVDYLAGTSSTVVGGYKAVSATPALPTGAVPILNSGAQIFANGTVGASGTATIAIVCDWTGSVAGTVDVAAGNATTGQYDPNNLTSGDITSLNSAAAVITPASGSAALSGGIVMAEGVGAAVVADCAFSDSYKGTNANILNTAYYPLTTAEGGNGSTITGFPTKASLVTAVNNLVEAGAAANAAKPPCVGILPIAWVSGPLNAAGVSAIGGSSSLPSNITQQAARALIGGGYVAQSQLTGSNSSTDLNNAWYLIGRNEDSGSRAITLAESQYGATAGPQQFALNSGATANLYVANTPLFTQPTIGWDLAGHSGYNKGSDIANALQTAAQDGTESFPQGDGADFGGSSFFLAYLGIPDAIISTGSTTAGLATNTSSAGVTNLALSYGGVKYSVAAVQAGAYTLWGFEHLYTTSSPNGQAIINAVADLVFNKDADIDLAGKHAQTVSTNGAPGILFASVLKGNNPFTRTIGEGGTVSANY